MPEGDNIRAIHTNLDTGTADLLTWHLRNRVPAPKLAAILTHHGHPTGVTAIKMYRAALATEADPVGAGDTNPALYAALADLRRDIEDKIAADTTARTLTIDIERVQGEFSGRFWSLNDMKGRRIGVDDVTAWPRTICVAAKWHDEDKAMFTAEWQEGHEAMIRTVWGWLDEADIVVGQNQRHFDLKHLRGEWSTYGMPDPSPYKTVDTLLIARSRFNFESNTLNALCERYGVPAKTDKYDPDVARAALAGDKDAQVKLMNYNIGDIHATEALYDKMRLAGHIPNHPAVTTALPLRCNACGSGQLEPLAKPYQAVVMAYQAWRCGNCGTILRGRHGTRFSDVRGIQS